MRSRTFKVTAEDDEQEITLELDPSAVIAGRVLDAFGRPVVGANVTAYQRFVEITTLDAQWLNLDMRSSYAHTFYRGVTDDRGSIGSGSGGRGVRAAGKALATAGPRWRLRYGATPAFYPNSPTLDEAARLTLAAGDVREGADIRLGPPAATRQTGRVIHGESSCSQCAVGVFRRGGRPTSSYRL